MRSFTEKCAAGVPGSMGTGTRHGALMKLRENRKSSGTGKESC
jgi:hypothetical protein